MGIVRKTRGREIIGSVRVGADAQSDAFKHIEEGVISIAPGTIASLARATITALVTNVGTADFLQVMPPGDLEQKIVPAGAAVVGSGTVAVYLHNPSAAAGTGVAKDWRYLLYRRG